MAPSPSSLRLLLVAAAASLFAADAFSFCAPLRPRALQVHGRQQFTASRAAPSQQQLQHQHQSRGSSLRMVDTNVIIGVAVGVLGLGGGIGVMAFAEGQVERFEERGSDAMSDETKTKLASQFMEDVEMQAVGLDDTISKMEAAMAKRQGVDVEELEKNIDVEEVLDDGW